MRADDDSWDIDANVGATALATAMVRAFENAREDRLFDDEFAQFFLDAASERGWESPYSAARGVEGAQGDPELAKWRQAMTDWTVCRTKFVDDFFVGANRAGCRQIVILGAGLDARAWRLPWESGTVVYEIDQPGVLEFKTETLRVRKARPTAEYSGVPIDLRFDWPLALGKAGFDQHKPSAWSAEGLLPYLPPAAQDLLLERIQLLSAPESRIAVDAYTDEFYSQESVQNTFQRMNAEAGSGDKFSEELFFLGERTAVAEWLESHGWTTASEAAVDAMVRYGRAAPEGIDTASLSSYFVSACRTG